VTLSEFAGKTVIIDFGATWCPPCVAELPAIQRLYDQYGEDVRFVLVSNEDPHKVRKFLNRKGYTMPVYVAHHPAPPVFRTRSIPMTHLLTAGGELAYVEKGAAKWDGEGAVQLLEQLMAR